MSDQNQDFYIGYLSHMPSRLKRFLTPWVLLWGLSLPLLAFLLVQQQQGFSTATFELGTLTEIEGSLITHPVPMLRISTEPDRNQQQASQDILLIGFGKMGAEGDLQVWEEQAGHSLEGYQVKLGGTLVYHNGKTLLELTEGKRALRSIQEKMPGERIEALLDGDIGTWKGEIIDPKCYFGVMKPGRAKPHRSCAALCIAGGIPPILSVSNTEEEVRYLLLMGEDYTPINELLRPFIAEGVEIQGKVSSRNGWDFIQIPDLTHIQRLP